MPKFLRLLSGLLLMIVLAAAVGASYGACLLASKVVQRLAE